MAFGQRTLERGILGGLRQSLARVYQDIRVDRALARLRTTRDSVAKIGLATGFCDGTHLARVLKPERGLLPAALSPSPMSANTPQTIAGAKARYRFAGPPARQRHHIPPCSGLPRGGSMSILGAGSDERKNQ
jgi:AraC-like DNA-binding protein